MSPGLFLVFTAVMGGLVYLHFFFAHRCWQRVSGSVPADIDPSYIRREDYFGQSFRTKLTTWLEQPGKDNADGTRFVQHNAERIIVSSALQLPDLVRCDDVLVIRGNFVCGAFSELDREVYAERNIYIGHDSRCQAIAADGDITLDSGTEVARWVDSWGTLRIRPGASVFSRACARVLVVLERGAEAHSVYAPLILTSDKSHATTRPVAPARVTIPPDLHSAEKLSAAGIDPQKFVPLGAECWIYQGSLRPTKPVHILTAMVVRGDCELPAGSLVEKNLKATQTLSIGEASECRGDLVAAHSIYLAPHVHFSGLIHSNHDVLLARGVRGESAGELIAVDAGRWLYAEEGITVRGKLSAGERVRVVDASFAELWKQKHSLPPRA